MELENLLILVKDYSVEDKALIIRAFEFASRVHAGVKRKSGEDYIKHPLSVACILAEMHADADTIAAGLLHDTIEDGENITKEIISEVFNPTIGMLVDGVTKMKKIEFNNNKFLTDEANTRKIIESITQDIRIFIIKLADRLHNMRTLEFHKPAKQVENAVETMELFIPFANLIGEYFLQLELEDLAFKYINPEEYFDKSKLKIDLMKEYRPSVDEMLCTISQHFNSNDMNFNVRVAFKNIYGLHKRLKTFKSTDNIHDFVTIKLLVEDLDKCYLFKEELEKIYPIIPERSKDYIKHPKTNMYQAIHLSTKDRHGRLIQIQVMTPEMYKINQYGLTAYWKLLKNKQITPAEAMQNDIKKFQFFALLHELTQLNPSNATFNREIKEDILSDQVYVYTPKGEAIELPAGSTPIDFAYKIHTDLGNSYIYAVVNGEYVTPDYKLKSDDVIEVFSDAQLIGPRRDYSKMCRAIRTKRKIREFKRSGYIKRLPEKEFI